MVVGWAEASSPGLGRTSPGVLSVKTHSPGVGARAQGDAGYSSYMAACPRLSLLLSLLILERAWGHSRQEKGAGRSP